MVNIPTPETFDVTNGDHVEYVLSHTDEYDDDQLQSIYNILDVEIKRQAHQLMITYNVQDVSLVVDLDAKMKLIDLVCSLAYGAKANFVDTFKQVRLWDIMIYHRLRALGKQIPPRKDETKTDQYTGAFVKDPLVGLHNWVVSFDVASMYPHIIREWNLSPETITDRETVGKWSIDEFLEQKVDVGLWVGSAAGNDHAMAGNGLQTCRGTEGFLPNMLKTLYDERVRFKGMMTKCKGELELVKAELVRRGLTDPK